MTDVTLPTIIAPPSAPVFLAAGHLVNEDGAFTPVRFATGHARNRRTRTVTERTVTVGWFLEAGPLADVWSWYEDELQSGALPFSARVANDEGDGLVYWAARWVDFQIEMLPKGRGRLTGTLYLYGEPSDVGPDLAELAAEVSVRLAGAATAMIPSNLAVEVVVALEADSADLTMQAEVSVALDGEATVDETLLASEVSVALDGEATATIVSGACTPFNVLADSGITVGADDAIAALSDAGETFDSCRDLQ